MRLSILAFVSAFIASLVVAPLVAASPVAALQTLIPSPYPVTVTGAQPLDPEPMELGGAQRLMRDPYPQILGDAAQGNPPIATRVRHQRLVPSLYQRKYKVDRPVRSGMP